MRVLRCGMHPYTEIVVEDGPGAGAACHHYRVLELLGPAVDPEYLPERFADIRFQHGPVQEVGANGCYLEDLLAIIIDRLEAFQAGPLACKESESARKWIGLALYCLDLRTKERRARGVEGLSVP